MELIVKVNSFLNGIVMGWPGMILLVGTGVYYTIRCGGVQFKWFGYIMKTTIGKIFDKKEAGEGSVTPFQAVCTALAATVGTGNIAGVTGAIALGGPGAVFWMWVSALFGMCTKFAEVTLAIHFRERNDKGDWVGGPMYYIKNGLGKKWVWLGTLFALFGMLAAFGIGNMTQINSIVTSISGTINSARNAALVVKERFPERNVYIVDSLGASSGYGLLMDTAATKRDEGLSAEELVQWLEENKLKLHHWFFSTDLTSYVRGGRISKTAAVFGGLLEICPLLNMDNLGRLIPRSKIRTKKRVIKEIVSRMEQHAQDGHDYSGKCYISNSACYDDARAVADLVEEKFPKLNGKVEINHVGTTIGSHTGPGTVALFFWGDERTE